VPGPDAAFFLAVQGELGALPFVAEDLGLITPDVVALRDRFDLPGNRVLQFAFDGDPRNPHLPDNYPANAVVYTGTHDNPTTRQWFDELPPSHRRNLSRYLNQPSDDGGEIAWELIRLAWSSRAALAVAPMQDLLNLGPEGRMNRPGHASGNWRWRSTEQMLSTSKWDELLHLTKSSSRLPAIRQPASTTTELTR
jgi:4-alpha-glucanotransferase